MNPFEPELRINAEEFALFKPGLDMRESLALTAAMQATVPKSEPSEVSAALAQLQAIGEAEVMVLIAYVRAYCTGWTLKDEKGVSIPYEPWPVWDRRPIPEAWIRIPETTFAAMSTRAQVIWLTRQRDLRDPKAPSPPDEPHGVAAPTSSSPDSQ